MKARSVAVVVVLAVALSGCLRRVEGPADPTGVVSGIVLAGPTCPVEPADGSGCDPVPVAGKVQFWDGDTQLGEVTIGRNGAFTADVPLGTHTVRVVPAGQNGFPVCADTTVTVLETGTSPLSLQCDTGIR